MICDNCKKEIENGTAYIQKRDSRTYHIECYGGE